MSVNASVHGAKAIEVVTSKCHNAKGDWFWVTRVRFLDERDNLIFEVNDHGEYYADPVRVEQVIEGEVVKAAVQEAA